MLKEVQVTPLLLYSIIRGIAVLILTFTTEPEPGSGSEINDNIQSFSGSTKFD